ncbi:MAG: bifunctional protein-serine/threonine kinase/phosphatase [Magnetococcales bacterium]|nr:bifunctional protein-serine/threonine kinase/phosphatase [Magnetococcales bacterium]
MNTPPSVPHLALAIGQASLASREHARNEDCHGVAIADGQRQAWGALVCVADGIGGCGDGRLAAEVTVRALLEDYGATPLGWRGVRALYVIANSINDWLFREGRWREGGLGTTLVAALFRDRTLSIVSAGDSRLYRRREGRVSLLTRDHLFGGPDLSVLTKGVGMDERFTPDTREEVLQEGDRYLLVSDGVWRELGEASLGRWLDPAIDSQRAATGLVEEAGRYGRDDATAVVVDVLNLPAATLPDLRQEWSRLVIAPLPSTGERVDRYRIRGILCRGIQGVVAVAWDEENGQEVVLKFPDLLAAADPVWLDQFSREEWIGLRVRHANLVRLIPQSRQRRTAAYHVWERLEGHTLEQLRQQRGGRGLPIPDVVDWLRQAARGLLALHRQGIVHRDVKPDNLFLTHDQRLVVLDFGTARIMGCSPLAPDPSGHRVVGGTPGFMAPELYQGHWGDPGSDLFALGVTAYLLLTGRMPFGHPESHLQPAFDRMMPLAILRPDMPRSLAAAVESCLALRPEERPGDLGELLSWLEQPELWSPPPAHRPLLQRNPLRFYQTGFWIFLLATLVLLLVRW